MLLIIVVSGLKGNSQLLRLVPGPAPSDFRMVFQTWLGSSLHIPGATFFILDDNVYFDVDQEPEPRCQKLEPEQVEKFLRTCQGVRNAVLGEDVF